jgi:hypothetical protein
MRVRLNLARGYCWCWRSVPYSRYWFLAGYGVLLNLTASRHALFSGMWLGLPCNMRESVSRWRPFLLRRPAPGGRSSEGEPAGPPRTLGGWGDEGFINDLGIASRRSRTVPNSRRDFKLDPPTQPAGFSLDAGLRGGLSFSMLARWEGCLRTSTRSARRILRRLQKDA